MVDCRQRPSTLGTLSEDLVGSGSMREGAGGIDRPTASGDCDL